MVWEKWGSAEAGKGLTAEGAALSKSKVMVCPGRRPCFPVAAA